MRKLLGMLQRDCLGFHAAHGEAGHCAIGLIGQRAEVGIGVGNQLVHENGFEGLDVEIPDAIPVNLSLKARPLVTSKPPGGRFISLKFQVTPPSVVITIAGGLPNAPYA